MFSRTNLEHQLFKFRSNRITEVDLLQEVHNIFSENEEQRRSIVSNLGKISFEKINSFDFDQLETSHIYHIEDIKKLCLIYRLRFLDSHYFKGNIPEEAVSNIRDLEKKHNTTLEGFKIIAPAKLLKLENADDPLLFAPMGNDYYYLIHKWGKDLHPLRKILMWPYKSMENIVITIFAVSLALTAITPFQLFTKTVGMQEQVLMFLFIFKCVAGIVIYYGFAKGKNFNGAIWNSKYYNA